MSELGNTTLAQLYEWPNRELLDAVVRAICLDVDCNYLEGLRSLETWSEAVVGTSPATELPLRSIFSSPACPMTLDRLGRDVSDITGRAAATERTILLDRTLPDEPDGEVDELGNVELGPDADRGRMLADPATVEGAYQEARLVSDDYDGADGRSRFESDLRAHVEGGIDFLKTLRRRHREEAIAMRQLEAERSQIGREHHERRRRAEARRRELAVRALSDIDEGGRRV